MLTVWMVLETFMMNRDQVVVDRLVVFGHWKIDHVGSTFLERTMGADARV